MKIIQLGLLLGLGMLEVAGQQLPASFDYGRDSLRIATTNPREEIQVYKGNAIDYAAIAHTASILGNTTWRDKHTVFTPLVPFDIETPYTMVYQGESFVFTIPNTSGSQALALQAIYPNTATVPVNILKWYIQFSKPVNPVKIYDHIQFLDESQTPIDRSILHLGAPLLSDDGTLLTVWVEPGRQKRLLGPNRLLGSVFKENHTYTLHIAKTLKDTEGMPITANVSHRFSTTAADRNMPAIASWKLEKPKPTTTQALVIKVNDQLDFGSLLDAISITHNSRPVSGALQWDAVKETISFTPSIAWNKGEYTIKVNAILEDTAGNNLNHLFDKPIDTTAVAKSKPSNSENQEYRLLRFSL